MKIFLKSYEDQTYLGGDFNISGQDYETLADSFSWNEAIEILKKNLDGEFRFYDTYATMIKDEGRFDLMITGLA